MGEGAPLLSPHFVGNTEDVRVRVVRHKVRNGVHAQQRSGGMLRALMIMASCCAVAALAATAIAGLVGLLEDGESERTETLQVPLSAIVQAASAAAQQGAAATQGSAAVAPQPTGVMPASYATNQAASPAYVSVVSSPAATNQVRGML